MKTIYEKYPDELLAIVIRENSGDIRANGDPVDILLRLIQALQVWHEQNPEDFDTVRGLLQTAFDFVGRDLDLEEELSAKIPMEC